MSPNDRATAARGGWRERFRLSGATADNLRVKAISELLVKAGRFLLFVLAARLLGADAFGRYAFAFTLGNILANGSDFGLQMYLSRRVAQEPESRAAVLRQSIRAKGLLTLLMLLLLLAATFLYPRPEEDRALVFAMGAASLAQSWTELWNYMFRGLQSLREEAMLNLVHSGLALVIGVALLAAGAGPLGLALALFVAAGITSIVAVVRLRRRGLLTTPALSLPITPALREAAPIGIAILISILYFRIDVLFLERMCDDAEVGRYGAAYRLLESLLFLPAIFLAAVYPAFAEKARTDRAEMRRLHQVTLRWMVVLSLAVVTGLLLFTTFGLRLLFGPGYEGSLPILRVLAPSLIFIYVNYGLTHFMVALHAQKWNAIFALACLLLNCGLNYLWIPRWAGVGAAAATVATEGLLFLLCFGLVARKMRAETRDAQTGNA
ncbi:MAG: flippase [Candidatus Eisenbacteria bacterium]|nr:flippase [Candidatus Eisenbacteria bacterium]MCC7142162.1 flippase [Candidatus Eisenbacteria bacterium]